MQRHLVALSIVASLMSTGCISRQAERSQGHKTVAREWIRSLRAHQMVAIYPPSDLVAVGDVYLLDGELGPEEMAFEMPGFLGISIRIGNVLDNKVEMKDDQGRPIISAAKAAFPLYSFNAKSAADVAAGIPLKSISIAAEAAESGEIQVSLALASADVASVNVPYLDDALRQWMIANKSRLDSILPRTTGGELPRIRVVTSTFAASEVVMRVSRVSSSGAKLSAAAQSAMPANGSVSIESSSESQISLSEKLDVPLVVGVHAMDFIIDRDGELLSIGIVHQRVDDRRFSMFPNLAERYWTDRQKLLREFVRIGDSLPNAGQQLECYASAELSARAYAEFIATALFTRSVTTSIVNALMEEVWGRNRLLLGDVETDLQMELAHERDKLLRWMKEHGLILIYDDVRASSGD